MIFRTFLVASGFGIAATYALTTKLDTVPLGSLLANKNAAWKIQFPNSTLPMDSFEMTIPRWMIRSTAVEEFARSFGISPVFSLERWLITRAELAVDVSVPEKFDKGERMAYWTVDDKSLASNEVLMVWKADKMFPFSGSTWLKVCDTNNGSVTLQMGSGLNIPDQNKIFMRSTVMDLHYFYSRVLLVNTAATMIFRKLFV
ncbi:hypothetical protein HDU98_001160 [Podochytrium sp. JEL0797]|nr:hypothetical protein HDU98_001160 [Podochytrium sp. JEL0797]